MSQSIQHIKRSNSNNRMETRSSGDFLIFSQQRIAIVCQARHVDSPNQSGCAKAIQVCKSLMRCSSPRLATVERAGPPAATLWILRRPLWREPGPSGDNARRSPVCSLWILRRPLWRELGPQRRQRAPQPLLQSLDTAPATVERAGPPAATTRAAAPSAVSADCAGHCGESRAPSGDNARRSPAAVSGYCAGHCGESRAPSSDNARRSPSCSLCRLRHCGQSRAPSGDNARRSPFCSLWILRLPLWREPGPQDTAPATVDRAGPPAARTWREPGPQRRQRAPQPRLQSLDTAPATLERAGPRAPQPLLQSLDTAPATVERAGPPAATTRAAAPSAVSTAPATVDRAGSPAATTRAAAPSAVSGYCAGHCGESRAPSSDNARRSPFCSLCRLRRPLWTEPGPSGDNARRSPFCSLWILRLPLWREPGPQDTAPATVDRAGRRERGESRAPSGDNARRSSVCSLWILRRPLWREPGPQRRQRAPQPLLQSLDTAPATVERAGPPAATTRAAAPSAVIADVFVICICVCVRCERRRFVMNCDLCVCVCVRCERRRGG